MIPKSVPISWNKTYVHETTGMAYIIMCTSHKFKQGDKWLDEGVVIYRRLNEPTLYSRLESDFRAKFRRAVK